MEAAEVVAPPAPEEASEAESEGADWDALDLDEIALPGQKSSKEVAAEKVGRRVLRPLSASGADEGFVNGAEIFFGALSEGLQVTCQELFKTMINKRGCKARVVCPLGKKAATSPWMLC